MTPNAKVCAPELWDATPAKALAAERAKRFAPAGQLMCRSGACGTWLPAHVSDLEPVGMVSLRALLQGGNTPVHDREYVGAALRPMHPVRCPVGLLRQFMGGSSSEWATVTARIMRRTARSLLA